MKALTALALAIILCTGLVTTASAHGWHGRRGGHHGYYNGWDMRADGYYRGGGPCWYDQDADVYRQQYERRNDYRDDRQRQDRDYQRDDYRDQRRR